MPSRVFGRPVSHLRRSVGAVSVINARPVGFKPLRGCTGQGAHAFWAAGIRDPRGTIPPRGARSAWCPMSGRIRSVAAGS